jgi:hypothetical protein
MPILGGIHTDTSGICADTLAAFIPIPAAAFVPTLAAFVSIL